MEWVRYFFTQYFILLCITVVVIVNVIQHFYLNKRVSLFSITIITMAILLALSGTIEIYGKATVNAPLTTVFSVVGYVTRPTITYLFVLMSLKKVKNKLLYLTSIPLFINLGIYLLSFVPGLEGLVVSFELNDLGGLSFHAGTLRFTSHVIALGYIIWWFALSILRFRKKHINQGITIMLCGIFCLLAVYIETFEDTSGESFLLNTIIGLSVLVYFLHVYTEVTQVDTLTNLYNRSTYYHDLPKMRKSTTAVVQFDINGLKYLNDNFGHEAGDLAISTIAEIINKHSKGNMYGYRIGGDEFTVLVDNGTLTSVTDFVDNISKDIANTKYSCSVGYCYRENEEVSFEDLIKNADENMYKNKNEYYKTSDIKRR